MNDRIHRPKTKTRYRMKKQKILILPFDCLTFYKQKPNLDISIISKLQQEIEEVKKSYFKLKNFSNQYHMIPETARIDLLLELFDVIQSSATVIDIVAESEEEKNKVYKLWYEKIKGRREL